MRKLWNLLKRNKNDFEIPEFPERSEISEHPDVFTSADIGRGSPVDSELEAAKEIEKGRVKGMGVGGMAR